MENSEINKLGKELEIYTTIDYVGKGFPVILPKGAKMIKIIRDYVEREEEKNGYKVVRTPSVSKAEIYKIEDRYDVEEEELFTIKTVEDESEENNNIVLKPYSQPFHCSIYNTKQHTYKELPIKYSETSMIFRNEKEAKGITKARQFTLSDASIFSSKADLLKQIKDAITMQKKFIDKMELDVTYTVKYWDEDKKENYIGQVEEWNFVTDALENALKELEIPYQKDNKARMYGPAISIEYNGKDFSTLQIDFEIVHRFDVKFVNNKNEDEFPIYMHLTVIGSYENLMSILIEKYNGDFPVWLAAIQVIIITDGEEFEDYANQIKNELLNKNIRVEIDNSENNVQSKELKAIENKVPFIVRIGKKEYQNKVINVRNKDEIKECNIKEFSEEVLNCLIEF